MAEIARRVNLGNMIKEQHFLGQEDAMSTEIKKVYESACYDGVLVNKYELLDNAYRASGGFEDGSYLVPHPREQSAKYIRRRNLAYYINYVKPVGWRMSTLRWSCCSHVNSVTWARRFTRAAAATTKCCST